MILSQRCDSLADLGGLAERAQAPSANLNLYRLAILHQGLLVNIGRKTGLCMAVGVADVITGHPSLETNFTSHIV